MLSEVCDRQTLTLSSPAGLRCSIGYDLRNRPDYPMASASVMGGSSAAEEFIALAGGGKGRGAQGCCERVPVGPREVGVQRGCFPYGEGLTSETAD